MKTVLPDSNSTTAGKNPMPVVQPTSVKPNPQSMTAAVPAGGEPHRPMHWWVWLIVLAVAALSVASVFWLVRLNANRAKADEAVKKGKHDTPVVVATARVGNLDLYLTGLGTVTPFNSVTLKSRVDGAIKKVNFVEGQMVKKDTVLVEIDPDPYNAALGQAKGQLAKDTAVAHNADAVVKMDSEANQGRPGSVAQNTVLADRASSEEAKAAMQADQAAIDAAQVNVNYTLIKSPVDGRIGLRLVDEGNIVHASDTTGLAVINQLSPIYVIFTLPEGDIPRVQKQMQTGKQVKVLAFNSDLSEELAEGFVLTIDNQIDTGSGTVRVKAQFDNNDLDLFPNQFVNARLEIETVKDAVLVPSAAIQPGTAAPYVYVVSDITKTEPEGNRPAGSSGTVHMRNVAVGNDQPAIRAGDEDLSAVTSGLQPGDVVVIDGVDKLIDGAKVSLRPAAPTSRPTGGKSTTKPASTMPAATTMPGGGGGDHPSGRGHKKTQ